MEDDRRITRVQNAYEGHGRHLEKYVLIKPDSVTSMTEIELCHFGFCHKCDETHWRESMVGTERLKEHYDLHRLVKQDLG